MYVVPTSYMYELTTSSWEKDGKREQDFLLNIAFEYTIAQTIWNYDVFVLVSVC